jgi:S1-C subfamily serine protease
MKAVGGAVIVSFALQNVLTAQSVTSGRQFGSAFAVDARGKLLTNNHVVEGCTDVDVFGGIGGPRSARVEARDAQNDLALLDFDSQLQSVAMFRPTPARAGEDVVALGFPLRGLLATDLHVSKGIVSATAGIWNDTSKLQISAAVQPGNSGGPLLDDSASVAGVVAARLDALVVAKMFGGFAENVNFAIKAEVAETFLVSHGVRPLRRQAGSQSVSVPEAVERARGYTFAVECDPLRPASQPSPTAANVAPGYSESVAIDPR